MLILLPPSEGKTAPKRGFPVQLDALSFPELSEHRAEMVGALVSLCTTDGLPLESEAARHVAERALGLGSTQSAEIDKNARLRSAPTARADRVYSGVLYEALDLPSLEGAAKRRATQWVAITSSLFGLVRPGDRIPSYRLAGNVTLPGIGAVATYWNRHLDQSVQEAAGNGLVVDLRSSTYAAFWRPSRETASRVVGVRVLHEHNGTRKVVSHFNKATKGRLVRDVLEDGGVAATPWGFAEQLGDLGWTVEEGPKKGVLDVVVSEL
ncbi:MAG TPA: peroxide stress protein YaaA [Nocardioidaceae bacterium]|nr:peroxide stress protein YaaA [Nocardioidaceae bacterium]